MEALGFDVRADPVVVQDIREDERSLQIPLRFGEASRVFVVVISGEETDHMPITHVPRCSDTPKPQVIMIRGIPWIALRHLRGASAGINTQYLADVWKISFREAKACFRSIRMENQSLSIAIEDTNIVGIIKHQKTLIPYFSPELERFCGTAMRHYLPCLHVRVDFQHRFRKR